MNEKLWKEVIEDKRVINCESFEELTQYLDFLNREGYECILGPIEKIKEKVVLDMWNLFHKNTCIRVDKGKNFHFNSKTFYTRTNIRCISTYKELMQGLNTSNSNDLVNHPSHYKQGKYETIDVIESVTGKAFEGYLVGNVVKYVSRYKYKNGIEDLKKAMWYLNRLIEVKSNE